jgi:pimeloyl-ACP methyl ester carboxylesterase
MIKNILVGLLIIMLVLFLASYICYRIWKTNLIEELYNNSQIIQTTKGPVEYAMMGEGPIVFIVHGGASGYDNIYLYKFLAENGYTLICPSRPGYVRTPLNDGASFEEQADVMAAFLDALEIKNKVTVLTISLGGPSALQFVMRHSDKVNGLIFQDAVCIEYLPDQKAENSFMGKLFLSGLGKYVRDYLNWLEYISAKYYPESFFAELLEVESLYTDEECQKIAAQVMQKKRNKELLLQFVQVTSPMSLRMTGCDSEMMYAAKLGHPDYSSIKIPVLITHCRMDRDVPIKHGEYLASQTKRSQLYTFNGYGHLFWFDDDYQMVENQVLNFLNAIYDR